MTNRADPDQKPTDMDLHCLLRQGIPGFGRNKVKVNFLNSELFCSVRRPLFTQLHAAASQSVRVILK